MLEMPNFENKLEGQIKRNILKNETEEDLGIIVPQLFHGMLMHLSGVISQYRPFTH